MGAFDRSKFAATKTSNLKEQEAEQSAKVGRRGDRVEFKRLEPGKNKLRIYPAHPGTKSFMYPRTVHFLPVEVDEKDGNGEKTGKRKVIRKPIFSAKVHLGLQNGAIPKCPADEYLTRAIQWCHDNIQDEEERKKRIAVLTGREGIKPATKWIAYADLYSGASKEFCRIELSTMVQQAMNEIAAGQDDEDGAIVTDPFTDPDTGRAIFVTYDNKAKKPADFYSTAIDINKVTPLTDDELGVLAEQTSLESMLTNCYRKQDFDMMIEGLKRFDEENDFGIFGDDDYLDILEEIGEYEFAPDRNSTSTKPEAKSEETSETSTSNVADEEEEEESDLPWDKKLEDMSREELKGYIRRKGLDIKILKRYTEQDLIEIIRDEEKIIEQNKIAAAEQEEKDEEEEEGLNTTTTGRGSRRGRSSRIDKLSGN